MNYYIQMKITKNENFSEMAVGFDLNINFQFDILKPKWKICKINSDFGIIINIEPIMPCFFSLWRIIIFYDVMSAYLESISFRKKNQSKTFQAFQVFLFERNGQNHFQVNQLFSSHYFHVMFFSCFYTQNQSDQRIANKLCESKYP